MDKKIRMWNYGEEDIKRRHQESKKIAERRNKIQQIGDKRASNKKSHLIFIINFSCGFAAANTSQAITHLREPVFPCLTRTSSLLPSSPGT